MPRLSVINVRDMDIMIISVLQRVNMLDLCPVMKLMSRRLLKVVHVPFKTVSIIEDTTVGADTLVIDEIHMSNSASDDVNEIVETTTLHFLVAYIDDITG